MNRRLLVRASALALIAAAAIAAALPKDTTVRLSLAPNGDEPDADCTRVAISGNGRYVAFASAATNLVADDGNGILDVFLCDTKSLGIERISVDQGGGDANGSSSFPAVSASGRYVAWDSAAADLVPFDGNGDDDVFVRDRKTGETFRVSVSSAGTEGNEESENAAISANGRVIAFDSDADNLVADDLNEATDIFVHDRKTGETTRVSVSTEGAEADGFSFNPAISANGRYVAFRSSAINLVEADGNGSDDVFLHDLKTGATVCASVDDAGVPQGLCAGRVALNANGRYLLFNSTSPDLVADDTNGDDVMDSFVFDRVTGVVERVTLGPDDVQAEDPVGGGIFTHTTALSANGRYAIFPSAAVNLVEGGTAGPQQIYVRDRKKHITLLMSVGPAGDEGADDSTEAAVSANGRTIGFLSDAGNLVDDDVLGFRDVFVRRW